MTPADHARTPRQTPNQSFELLAAPILAFDGRGRAALALRMAGYDESQIRKLLDRSPDLRNAADRRAA